jgi:NAD-dependent deacetylase
MRTFDSTSLASLLGPIRESKGLLVFLTGAGISAESGIPTFRGPEGYWTVGSSVYHPQELATSAAFQRMPDEVWRWYLHRRRVCRQAEPNPAHLALSDLEGGLDERFLLITQNVDGLHLRAGNTQQRCYEIHGNIDYMRCSRDCSSALYPIETDVVADLLCPLCGTRARPHVLWFDECYDETLFRFESSLRAASQCELIVTIGTSASTNLPVQAVALAQRSGAVHIDINVTANDFGATAHLALQGKAGELMPRCRDLLLAP